MPFFNMRLIFLSGQLLWSEQTWLATQKIGPTQNCYHMVCLATGRGEDFLRLIWQETTGQATSWARLGIALYTGHVNTNMVPYVDAETGLAVLGVEEDEVPERVASFLWHCIETRF